MNHATGRQTASAGEVANEFEKEIINDKEMVAFVLEHIPRMSIEELEIIEAGVNKLDNIHIKVEDVQAGATGGVIASVTVPAILKAMLSIPIPVFVLQRAVVMAVMGAIAGYYGVLTTRMGPEVYRRSTLDTIRTSIQNELGSRRG